MLTCRKMCTSFHFVVYTKRQLMVPAISLTADDFPSKIICLFRDSLSFYVLLIMRFHPQKIPINGYAPIILFSLYLPRFFIGYWILNGAGFSSGPPFFIRSIVRLFLRIKIFINYPRLRTSNVFCKLFRRKLFYFFYGLKFFQ